MSIPTPFYLSLALCTLLFLFFVQPKTIAQSSSSDSLQALFHEVTHLLEKEQTQAALQLAHQSIAYGKQQDLEDNRFFRYTQLWRAFCLRHLQKIEIACPEIENFITILKNEKDSLGQAQLIAAYREQGICQYKLNGAEAGTESLQKALQTCLQLYGEQHYRTANMYHYLSQHFLLLGEFEQAISYSDKGLDITTQLYGKEAIQSAEHYHQLGQIYSKQRLYKTALPILEQALEIRKKHYTEHDPRIAHTLEQLARVYYKTEANDRSLNYYEAAIKIYQSNGDEYKANRTKLSMSAPYIVAEDLAKSEAVLLEAKIYFEQAEVKNPLNTVYLNLAIIESIRGNLAVAQSWYEQNERFLKKYYNDQAPGLYYTYFNRSKLYLDFNEFELAEFYIKKGLQHAKTVFGKQSQQVGNLLMSLSMAQANQQHYTQAEKTIKETVEITGYEPLSPKPFEKIENIFFAEEALEITAKIYKEHFEYEEDWAILDTALQTFVQLDQLLKYRRTSYNETATQHRISAEAREFYRLGLEVCHQLWQHSKDKKYLEQAFSFMESSKIQLLLADLRSNSTQFSSLGLPQTILQQQNEYEEKLQELEETLYKNQEKDNISNTIEQQIFKTKEAYYTLLEQMEKEHTSYYHFKYNTQTMSLDETQRELLDEQTTLIEYFIEDSILYTILLTTKEIEFFQNKLSKSFFQDFNAFTDVLQTNAPDHKRSFQLLSQRLSDVLLTPLLGSLPPTTEKLIIIPDNILAYLPFEVFMLNKSQTTNQSATPSYLLTNFQIAYAWSSTLLGWQKKQERPKPKKLLAGFAPNYEHLLEEDYKGEQHEDVALLVRDGKFDLPGAIHEVQQIHQLVGGDIFLNQEANEAKFKEVAKNYQVLHLSMHSLFNKTNPLFSKLIFTPSQDTLEDGLLYASELYNMQLNADLAVLSACNTGFGKLEKGEGIMSLSRAFTYTGVPATITSLWKVPDHTTSKIMVAFYKHLKAGRPKDTALRQAKLDYLENTIEPDQQHPYYWAGFVAVGDMRALDLGVKSGWNWGIWGLVIFVLVGLLFWRLRGKE